MVDDLGIKIEQFFNRPGDFDHRVPIIVEDRFFDAVKHFSGATTAYWGPEIPKLIRSEGDLCRYMIIDGQHYECHGNWYDRTTAQEFVKNLVLGVLKPTQFNGNSG